MITLTESEVSLTISRCPPNNSRFSHAKSYISNSFDNASLIVVGSIGDHCILSTSTITLIAVLAPYPHAIDSPAPLGSRYVNPETFELYKIKGLEMGFKVVESGPLVRSSYHADEQVEKLTFKLI